MRYTKRNENGRIVIHVRNHGKTDYEIMVSVCKRNRLYAAAFRYYRILQFHHRIAIRHCPHVPVEDREGETVAYTGERLC